MRHLTASQKIAILENRVAQLEKQAMLEGLKAKIADAMSPFKRLFPHTKKIIKDTRKSPKQIAQEYMKVRKDPNFKKAMKQLQREAGSSPVKQVAYVIDAYQSGELEPTPRTASMRRRGGLLDILGVVGLSGAITATILIVGICIQWVESKVRGLFKLGSMDKEASPIIVLSVIVWIISLLSLMHSDQLRDNREKETELKKQAVPAFIKEILSPFVEDIKIGEVKPTDDYEFTSYVFLNGEEYAIEVSIFDSGRASLSIGHDQIYFDRMNPPLLNSRKLKSIRYRLQQSGVI